MGSEYTPRTRPYWHVDAKWIVGLLLVAVLSLTLLVYGLVQVTAEKPAVDTMSLAMALAFSEKGLDDESEIAQLRQKLQGSPDKSLQPIPGLRVTVREEEIANLSPRQARLLFMRKFAEPIYQGGVEGLAALADDPEMKKQIIEGGGPLNLFTRKTHETLQSWLRILGIASSVLLILLILFSYRFGRLGSPGCVLFVASLPGAILFGLLSTIGQQASATPPAREAGYTALASHVASNVLPPLAQLIVRNYLIALASGVGLMVLAVVSNLVWWVVRKRRAV